MRKKKDFIGKGHINEAHWNTNLSLPSSTTHTFLQLTEVSSRCEPQASNEANKGSISRSSLVWPAQLSPVQQQHTMSLVLLPQSSPALGFSELLLCYSFQTTQDCKCKAKLEISSLMRIHMNPHISRCQYKPVSLSLYLVTQASLLAVPLTQSNLYSLQGTPSWWISVRGPRRGLCHQNQHILLLNHFDTRHFLMQDTHRVTAEGSWGAHALSPSSFYSQL